MKFTDAQTKVIEYINSSDFLDRSDTQDTIASISILEKIIKGGFLTDGSQEGMCKSGYNTETNKYYRIEERAYVSGFMKKENARKFVERFNTETEKIAFIIQIDSTNDFDTLFYTKPSAVSSIPVTVSNSATTRSGIKSLYPDSSIKLVWPINTLNAIKQNVYLNKGEAVEYVVCIDPVYCRKGTNVKGLYKDIIKILAKYL
jgi:hypothetical protein